MVQKKNGVRLSLELHSDGAMDTSYHLGKSNWIFGKALSLSRWKPREQVVQRCCGVSALGDSENPTGRGSEEPALTRRAPRRREGCTTSGGPFQPMRFCDSLILQ